MPRRARLQTTFAKGVLDPGLSERVDLVHYYQAVRRGDNVEFLAQGGFTRRAGTRLGYPARMRRRIEPVALTAGNVVAHNGGTAANLVDQDQAAVFTTAAASGTNFIVAEIDLGTSQSIAFIDVIAYQCATSRADNALGIEWWTGSAWQLMTGPEDLLLSPRAGIRNTVRTRRFGESPGTTVTARNFRLVIADGTGLGAISVGGLRVWKEQAQAITAPRAIPFAKSRGDVYQVVAGDWNLDVFKDGLYLASIPIPVPVEMVDELNVEQSLDTLFLFHEDVPTPRIQRQGADDEWTVEPVPYANVPSITASTAFSGAQTEIQRVPLDGFAAGQSIIVSLGDMFAAPFTTNIPGNLSAQIVTALGTLPGVTGAGLTGTLVLASPPTVEVTFGGANADRAWPRIAVRQAGAGTVSAVSTVVQRGVPATGAMIGATTGYPRAGAIYQARMLVGGMRATPQTVLISRAGNVFDFTTTGSPITADLGMAHTLDTDSVETIEDIFVGRHLQVFTESGEWWSDNRTLDATAPVNFILATRYGVERAVPLLFAENATLFLEKGGRTVRDFLYADVSQSYEAEALSLLAPHLVTGARSIAYRRATTTAECNGLAVVNDDGTIAHLSLLRRQEVIAWARHMTPNGLIREVMTDLLDHVWTLTTRNGDLWLEKRDVTALTDCTVEAEIGALGVVTGLPACLEGRAVWALVAGDVEGPYTVSGGSIMLQATEGTAEIGIDFGTDVEALDLREQLQNAMPFRPPVRLYEAELALAATGHLQFGANGGEPEDVALRHLDGSPLPSVETGDEPVNDLLDVPMMQRLYTGRVLIENLEGWTETGRWRIRQVVPAPMTVRSVRLELSTRG